jgi:hypothetical protein
MNIGDWLDGTVLNPFNVILRQLIDLLLEWTDAELLLAFAGVILLGTLILYTYAIEFIMM